MIGIAEEMKHMHVSMQCHVSKFSCAKLAAYMLRYERTNESSLVC